MDKAPIFGSALVTGASGFVGSHLVKRLVERGVCVTVIVRRDSNLSELASIAPKIRIARIEGGQDLCQVLEQQVPDVVFHLASKFVSEHRAQDVDELLDSNVRFGTQLLEAMASSGVSRFVNTGTAWQHFGDAAYSPVCLYAATKQAFESILQFYVRATSLSAISLKLFDTYGPNDPRQKLFSILRTAINSESPIAFSPGEQLLDLVYIDDVVDAFMLSADRLLAGQNAKYQSYAVGSKKPRTLREIANIYAKVVDAHLNIAWGARPYRTNEVMVPWSMGAPIPGWEPKVSLYEGIQRIREGRQEGSIRE